VIDIIASWGRRRNRRKAAGERRQRSPLARLIRWRRTLIALASALALALTAAAGLEALDRPITTVAVNGHFQRVSPLEVERAVRQSVHGAGLVSVDLHAVGAAVKQLSWVDAVSVERSWPRGLTVTIVEQVAAARWGQSGLLNTRGELFAADVQHIPPELPQLSGPAGSETSVALRYLAIHGRLLETGMRLTALRLDARGAWEFDLDNGVTVRLGRKRMDERFEAFLATAAKIVAQRASDIAYVDMRYTNGFAIAWRGASAAHRSRGEEQTSDA
jgi:cell division protein FtsQ